MFKKRSYLGSNLPGTLWEKLKKKAHDVWDLEADGDRLMALRKKPDTAKVSQISADTSCQCMCGCTQPSANGQDRCKRCSVSKGTGSDINGCR